MGKDIKLEEIINFQIDYEKNENNKELEMSISKYGIGHSCLNKELLSQCKYHFNIEIPEVKIYDQKRSYQCNIYAFLRMLKSIVRRNEKKFNDIDLSANYLDFYDKLEKINTLYNELFNQEHLTIELINEKVNQYVGIYGTFHFCRELVKKYGLVPTEVMPEVNNKYNANEVLELLRMKIKTDATILLNTKIDKEKVKKQLMQEAYNFLSLVMGNPPTKFKYKKELLNPLEFKNKYFNCNLEDYITVTSYKKEILENSYSYIPNVYLSDKENIKTISVDEMKRAVIKQLQDGIAIWFSAEESTTLDYDTNILDTNTFNYQKLLYIQSIPKEDKLKLDLINYDHAMTITGALVENNKIKQFKVDNSFGPHGKYKGHLIMTNSFFENCIITAVINKKYL